MKSYTFTFQIIAMDEKRKTAQEKNQTSMTNVEALAPTSSWLLLPKKLSMKGQME